MIEKEEKDVWKEMEDCFEYLDKQQEEIKKVDKPKREKNESKK